MPGKYFLFISRNENDSNLFSKKFDEGREGEEGLSTSQSPIYLFLISF